VAFLIAILTLALIGLVVLVVGAPLRSARRRADAGSNARETREQPGGGVSTRSVAPEAHTHDELEAAREAKYREIRDTELDFRTGKLSHEDYEAIDAELRAEAIEILDQIEQGAAHGQRTASDSHELPGAPTPEA
jgi:hypothetical protein